MLDVNNWNERQIEFYLDYAFIVPPLRSPSSSKDVSPSDIAFRCQHGMREVLQCLEVFAKHGYWPPQRPSKITMLPGTIIYHNFHLYS